MDPWCRARLGAAPAETLFVVAHLSEVVGARLADGREVVLKRRRDEAGRARHCVEAQGLLARQGFPCPEPLTGAVVEAGLATHAERLVGGGAVDTRDTPAAATRSARRLAGLDLAPPLPNLEWVRSESPPERHRVAAVPAWLAEAGRRVEAKLADAYAEGRGSRFSADEREIAWAASLWVALHNARDELSFDRPRLSYERLEEQRDERLRRAAA